MALLAEQHFAPHSMETLETRFFANGRRYSFVAGDASSVLSQLPSESVDCVVTSPPYFQQRDYEVSQRSRRYLIGEESNVEEYIEKILAVSEELLRVIKPQGALWLNIGDKYENKNLLGVPWLAAFALKRQGWILRDDIIWNQRKGTQSVQDRMRDAYEHLFFFVKNKKYYFNADNIRIKPMAVPTRKNGLMVSASGVSGKKYRSQIESSKMLSRAEKMAATQALENVVEEMRIGRIVDFRMTIRGVQRTYHGESEKMSGRAKELQKNGFFFIKMKSEGFLPTNIWDIVPEDERRKDTHCAVFPKALADVPIKATCPPRGVVLDPFCGTGTTIIAALENNRFGIGIDLSADYLSVAERRVRSFLL